MHCANASKTSDEETQVDKHEREMREKLQKIGDDFKELQDKFRNITHNSHLSKTHTSSKPSLNTESMELDETEDRAWYRRDKEENLTLPHQVNQVHFKYQKHNQFPSILKRQLDQADIAYRLPGVNHNM